MVVKRALFLISLLAASSQAQALQKLAVTVGPTFPQILTGEIDLLYTPRWSIGFNGGGFAYTVTAGGNPTPLAILGGSLRARWHPFQGAFFLGLAGGLQRLAGSQSRTFAVDVGGSSVNVPATAGAQLLSPYVTPYLGWQFVTGSGFTFGLEAGFQLNVGSTSSVSISTSDPSLNSVLPVVQASASYIDTLDTVQSKISQIGNLQLPYASIRLGWVF